jgi:hypothetical protein
MSNQGNGKGKKNKKGPKPLKFKKVVPVLVKNVEGKKAKKSRKRSGGTPMAPATGMTPLAAPSAMGAVVGASYFKVKPLAKASSRGEGLRIRGRDYFDSVTVAANTPAGTTVVNVPINPTSLPGTRLQKLTQLYEKYRFRRFRITAVPSNATNLSGTYGMSYDRDPSDSTPPASTEGIRTFMAMVGSVISSEWVPRTLDCPLIEPTTDYFTNSTGSGDERLVDQGQFYFWLPTASPSTALSFMLLIEYDLELFVPALENEDLGVWYKIETGSGVTTTPSTGNKAGWNTLATATVLSAQGDLPELAFTPDASGNQYLNLAKGVWRMIQSCSGINPSASAVAYQWNAPTIVCNDGVQQNNSSVINESNNFVTSVATASALGQALRWDTLVIPEGGAKVYGNWGGSNAASSNQLGEVLMLVNDGEIFEPLVSVLGRPGKFGRKAREDFEKKKLEERRKYEEQVARVEAMRNSPGYSCDPMRPLSIDLPRRGM